MRIAIVGTGYVGLVSGACFADTGNEVMCVDIDVKKLEKLRNSQITIYEPGLEIVFRRNLENKRLRFTSDLGEAVKQSEIIFLCLPTPQSEDGSADLSYVLNVAEEIASHLERSGSEEYRIIATKSTVTVGTVDKIRDILKRHNVMNVDVVSNPEFLREGYAVEDFMKPDRVVIGSDSQRALVKMKDLYAPFVLQGNPVIAMDTASSEVTKYASNSYLAMRITFMNELANYAEAVGADIDQIRIGMGTDSRIGKRFLFPGIGYGGSCLPKDVKALMKSSTDHGATISLLSTAHEVNNKQKLLLVKKISDHFQGKVSGRHFAVWGLSFKPNTDDMREAPSVAIIKKLLSLGARVTAYDPAAKDTAKTYLGDSIRYAYSAYDVFESSDALCILTEWSEFRNPDYARIKRGLKSPVVFDGRNILSKEKLIEYGFDYYGIGRSYSRHRFGTSNAALPLEQKTS